VDCQTTTWGLKEHVAKVLQIPPIFHELVLDATPLLDEKLLADYCLPNHDAAALSQSITLTLIVSFAHCADSAANRFQKVALIAQMGTTAGDPAIAGLLVFAEDTDAGVRKAAVEALAAVVPKGDSRAVHAAGAGLADRSAFVRRASLETLLKVTDNGDQQALCVVAERLCHVTRACGTSRLKLSHA